MSLRHGEMEPRRRMLQQEGQRSQHLLTGTRTLKQMQSTAWYTLIREPTRQAASLRLAHPTGPSTRPTPPHPTWNPRAAHDRALKPTPSAP